MQSTSRIVLSLCLLLLLVSACRSEQPAPSLPAGESTPAAQEGTEDGDSPIALDTPGVVEEGGGEAYPAPGAAAPTTGPVEYPPPTEVVTAEESYPRPTFVVPTRGTPVLLDDQQFELEPLQAGDTEVRGRGPAGLPILLVDVAMGAVPITPGRIGEDGSFSLPLNDPLVSGTHVGIMLGDLAGSPFAGQEEQVLSDIRLLSGVGSVDSPVIGFVLVSQVVP